jgi:hypothetical protein
MLAVLSVFVALALSPGRGAAQPAAQDAVLPAAERLTWGMEPVEATSAKRGQVCLNGIWQITPMLDPAEIQPPGGVAYIRVPGSWAGGDQPGLVSRPAQGPAWARFGGPGIWCAWYIRKLKVPADWAGGPCSSACSG